MLGSPMVMGPPELHPDVWGGQEKVSNDFSFMKYALKAVPGVADVGDPHGGEYGPKTPALGSGSKMHAYHVDQHEKLKGLDVQ